MGVVDFELQRERRAELLSEAESRRAARGRQTKRRLGGARGLWKLASAWVIGR